jgi:predicted phosphoadenosine phosphosulfate sulfurtransferase
VHIQTYNKNENVLQATQRRIEFLFNNFANINVSISGGKDSTVLCFLLLKEANKRNRKIGVFFLDEEVVYESTTNQIDYLMSLFPDNINKLWLQIEFNLTNATSLKESQLKCWQQGKHEIWMRPKKDFSIKYRMWDRKTETIRDKNKGFGFYDAIENFENCYSNTAFCVGLRAVESPNRWRAMIKNPVNINNQKVFWATQMKNNNISAYPIYDWNFSDVWKFIYDNNIKYSKIYDLQYKKGYPINEIRVSSLIHEKSFKSICDLPEFEPKTYEKLCNRIQGISFAQETGKNSKMFKVKKLPKNFKSWIDYKDFLLHTYPDQVKKEIFIKRFFRHLNNEFVARQQCRQLILNDYENNLPIENKEDSRIELINYYKEVL